MNIKSHNTLKCVLFLGFIQIIYLATTKGGERKEQKKKKERKEGWIRAYVSKVSHESTI